MTLRWTDEQLEAHRKRMGGAKGSEQRIRNKEADELLARTPTAKQSKYGAIKVGKHASKKESRRAQELHLMEKAGTIQNLREQGPRFELIPAQYIDGKCVERAVTYTPDFTYQEVVGGMLRLAVEDVKSSATKTQQYVIRRKLMLKIHGIRIKET